MAGGAHPAQPHLVPLQHEPMREALAQCRGCPCRTAGYVEDLVALAAVEVVMVPALDLEPRAALRIHDSLDSPVRLQTLECPVHGRLSKSRTIGLGSLEHLLRKERARRGF